MVRRFALGRNQERRKHCLQSVNERVGFLVALKQRGNLLVLFLDLGSEESVFTLKAPNVSLVGVANVRVRSRLFGAVRCRWWGSSTLFSIVRTFASVRDWSRPVATVRTSLMYAMWRSTE